MEGFQRECKYVDRLILSDERIKWLSSLSLEKTRFQRLFQSVFPVVMLSMIRNRLSVTFFLKGVVKSCLLCQNRWKTRSMLELQQVWELTSDNG
jgi:hypothetical protein